MKSGFTHIYLPLGQADHRALVKGIDYDVAARNASQGYRCEFALQIKREEP